MATNPTFDVLAIGNAIVDVLSRADDDFLIHRHLRKGGMSLIDESAAESLYAAMGPSAIVSGGSAANSMVGVASLGGRAAFVGKVRNDEAGRAFTHDIRAAGVTFVTAPAETGAATARCMIIVTPDGERTMSTYLGACVELGPEDIDERLIESSAIVYFEGYLWDPPRAKAAFHKAAVAARRAGRRIAFTLSDAFCVDRYRDEFLSLIREGLIDILFANESELHALFQTGDLSTALAALGAEPTLGFITRSGEGCVIVDGAHQIAIPAAPIDRLVDTTGAGDLFASGVLLGLAQGRDYPTCAKMGAIAAAEVIQHYGARPEGSLEQRIAQSGLSRR